MGNRRQNHLHRPFECLKELLAVETLPAEDGRAERTKNTPAGLATDPLEEKRLFEEAMTGVREISRENCVPGPARHSASPEDQFVEDNAVIGELRRLVQSGAGFVIADTPEYIEGRGCLTHPEITALLHRGNFSIQDHLDLHGLSVAEAEAAFEEFIGKSIADGKRAVLIIHGRGLSSPGEPVLKSKVYRWLTQNRWRKWVIAFTSARMCDGGAGASYVLLRRRPLTKSQRSKRRPSGSMYPPSRHRA